MLLHNAVYVFLVDILSLSVFQVCPYSSVAPEGVVCLNRLYLGKDYLVFLMPFHRSSPSPNSSSVFFSSIVSSAIIRLSFLFSSTTRSSLFDFPEESKAL